VNFEQAIKNYISVFGSNVLYEWLDPPLEVLFAHHYCSSPGGPPSGLTGEVWQTQAECLTNLLWLVHRFRRACPNPPLMQRLQVGFGAEFSSKCLENVFSFTSLACTELGISFIPRNEIARMFYVVKSGEVFSGPMPRRLKCAREPARARTLDEWRETRAGTCVVLPLDCRAG